MAKNDNTHALRFYESLARLDEKAAVEFAAEHPLSKSADYKKKFAWAKAQCEFLEGRFTPEETADIRAGCHCEAGAALAARMRGYLAKAGDMAEFADIFNAREKYVTLAAAEGGLLFIYPECYCSCVKRTPEPISRTWCLCTLGHIRGLMAQVLGREPEVELLETIKSGSERCVVKVII